MVILALTLLGSSVARAASHLARTAGHRKAVKAPVSKPPAGKPLAGKPPAKLPASKSPASCANTNLQPTRSNLAAIDAATFCLIGQVRAANHLPALRFSYPLQSVATGQTRDMVAGDYFGDNSISGLTPMQRILATPYPSHAARVNSAQNIGWATGPLATPAGMVEAWMHSPPHREIILTARFRDIGVGVTPAAPSSFANGLEGATYTLELGQRVFSAKVAKKTTRTKTTKH
ncbi:MAG TPA: CAP domain-containing protein [Solirubrobacteraceae bacterium]|jgi:uncharacterized protein YkwD